MILLLMLLLFPGVASASSVSSGVLWKAGVGFRAVAARTVIFNAKTVKFNGNQVVRQ
jgi:hypothetical protein